MSTNRLYTVFSLITLLALVSAGAIAIPMLVGSLNTAQNTVSVSAEQARLDQRQGEWHAGQAAVSVDPEIARFVAYSSALAEQARLAFRRGEWHAGSENIYAPLDQHERNASVTAAGQPAVDVEQARLQWRATK